MDKMIASNSIPKSEYWNLITSTLSSYEVKDISDDGTVKRRLVKDDYFLVKDIWNVDDIGQIPNFKKQNKNYKGQTQNLKFPTDNYPVALELKFILYRKFFNDELSISSLFINYQSKLNRLVKFLSEKHPRLHSLLDLDIDKAEKEWVWWLNSKGLKIVETKIDIKNGEYERRTRIATFFRSFYEILFNLTDMREEWEKDKWDARVLKDKFGIPYNISEASYFLDFTSIQKSNFKQYVKTYIKTRLLSGKKFSFGTARNYLKYVPNFLNFITLLEPSWNDLNCLSRMHIEKYLERLHSHSKKLKNKTSYMTI